MSVSTGTETPRSSSGSSVLCGGQPSEGAHTRRGRGQYLRPRMLSNQTRYCQIREVWCMRRDGAARRRHGRGSEANPSRGNCMHPLAYFFPAFLCSPLTARPPAACLLAQREGGGSNRVLRTHRGRQRHWTPYHEVEHDGLQHRGVPQVDRPRERAPRRVGGREEGERPGGGAQRGRQACRQGQRGVAEKMLWVGAHTRL